MESVSPENTLTAVNQASETIVTKGLVDCSFPDLRNTFDDAPKYEVIKNDLVQPVTLKQSIILPNEGLETIKQYNPKTSPSGIAPFINKAYYAIKNNLYLWDYVDRRMIVHEERDDIVGVAFVKPKAGIFTQEINYLMIIATVYEIKIIATNYHPMHGLKVFNTDMSTTSSGVNMTSILGTKFGRVFMLGSDGNIWELDYREEETWFAGKCSKKIHTSESKFTFLTSITKDPIVQIAVNENGTVLYHLTEGSTISVTDLGVDGQSFKTVQKFDNVLAVARRSVPNSSLLDPHTFKIISINPTLAKESTQYHLVAITSSGCRLYFNHNKGNQYLIDSPNTFELSHVRTPANDVTPHDVFTKAYYKDGLFMGVKNAHEKPSEDKIITYSPDLAILTNNNIIVELNNEIKLPGKVISIVEATSSPYRINELTSSYEMPGRIFIALTTFGVSLLYKQRPIDMLRNILESTNVDTALRLRDYESFFSHFGHVNTVSICFGLICSANVNTNDPIETISPTVVQGAISLLEKFGQVPSTLDNRYTSRHDGLALFISRIISPVWDEKIINESAAGVYTSNLTTSKLQSTYQVLRKLTALMKGNPNLFHSTFLAEEKSFYYMNEFATYTAEAIAFIQYINDTDLTVIVKNLKPASQSRCKTITLKELLTKPDGRSLASDLSYALVNYTFSQTDNTAYVIDVLTQRCKSFCGANEVLLYKACQQISSARSASNPTQAKAILTESLNMLNKIALHIPADKAAEIVKDFADQNYHIYGIKLALACSKARDPQNITNTYVDYGASLANETTVQTFKNKQPFYDIIYNSLFQIMTKSTDPVYRSQVFNTAFQGCDDKAFAYYVFEKFLAANLGQDLIKESPTHLESFLKHSPITYDKLSLLADYYKRKEKFEEAATTYYQLATAAPDLKSRISNLISASVCAKCVTAPAQQFKMYQLNEAIQQNLTEARHQEVIPSQ